MIKKFAFLAFIFTLPSVASGEELIEAAPATWRIQDYLDGGLTIFFAGSPCIHGSVALAPSAPAESKNRLWALIQTSQVTGRTVGIYYDVSGSTCTIRSFYAKEQ